MQPAVCLPAAASTTVNTEQPALQPSAPSSLYEKRAAGSNKFQCRLFTSLLRWTYWVNLPSPLSLANVTAISVTDSCRSVPEHQCSRHSKWCFWVSYGNESTWVSYSSSDPFNIFFNCWWGWHSLFHIYRLSLFNYSLCFMVRLQVGVHQVRWQCFPFWCMFAMLIRGKEQRTQTGIKT